MLISGLRITSYNVELHEGTGFVGDKASVSAFLALVEQRRNKLALAGPSPFGDDEEITPEHFDAILTSGIPEQSSIAEEILAEYTERLVNAISQHLELEPWQHVTKILVGGGFDQTLAGQAAISRAGKQLASRGTVQELKLIRHKPDEAGLIGCIHLASEQDLHDAHAVLTCDIGGTNFRCGIVSRPAGVSGLAGAKVWAADKCRHGGHEQPRDQAVDQLNAMFLRLLDKAQNASVRLAPFVGIACPGTIRPNGQIERGAQNLPGDWEDPSFNLPRLLGERLSHLGQGENVVVCMHNDAVAQGLSEAPFMLNTQDWAIVTIGTGFGNATFHQSP
jgi:hypothetical protein